MKRFIPIAILACAFGCVSTPTIDNDPIVRDLQSAPLIWAHAFTNATIHAIAEEIEDDANAVLPADKRISIRIATYRPARVEQTDLTDSKFDMAPPRWGNLKMTPWDAILTLRDITAMDLEVADRSRTVILFPKEGRSANKASQFTSQ